MFLYFFTPLLHRHICLDFPLSLTHFSLTNNMTLVTSSSQSVCLCQGNVAVCDVDMKIFVLLFCSCLCLFILFFVIISDIGALCTKYYHVCGDIFLVSDSSVMSHGIAIWPSGKQEEWRKGKGSFLLKTNPSFSLFSPSCFSPPCLIDPAVRLFIRLNMTICFCLYEKCCACTMCVVVVWCACKLILVILEDWPQAWS